MNKTLEFGTQTPILSNYTKFLKIQPVLSHRWQPSAELQQNDKETDKEIGYLSTDRNRSRMLLSINVSKREVHDFAGN